MWSRNDDVLTKNMIRTATNRTTTPIRLSLCALVALSGCSVEQPFVAHQPGGGQATETVRTVSYEEATTDAASTDVDPAAHLSPLASAATPAPFDLDTDADSIAYWNLSIDDAVQHALANATVLRDIGASILQAPQQTPTIYDPSIVASDARFGEEAALSAFDAQLDADYVIERNDRALNNSLLGGGTNFFEQDLSRYRAEVSKRTAAGGEIAIRHNVEDDFNNAPNNIFGSAGDILAPAWSWNFELEARQSLLRGRGATFNRIAGPDGAPGEINGVLIARVNNSISAADFQLALRSYLSNVHNAYWELVFAYRNLDVRKAARDRSLATWQRLKELNKAGLAGAEDDKLAQAEEQYYRFQQDVENALGGRLVDGTRTFNGSTGGSFQGVGGVYVAERRLRMIIGAPISDGRLIRPVTDASPAEFVFSWDDLQQSALASRTELLQQRLRIKRRRLELVASRNFLLPQLDVTGRYRRRGFGDNLYDPNAPGSTGGAGVSTGTDEWQLALELNVPIGFRQAHAAVRNTQLILARERAVLAEIERRVLHDVSNAVADQTRAYRAVQTAHNSRTAAWRQFNVLNSETVQESGRGRRIDYNLLLDAERRLAEADIAYHRAAVEHAVSLKNVNLETENLLPYSNVQLAGGGLAP